MPKTKMTSKGQVTIPKRVRDNLGLRPGDEIEFLLEGAYYRVKKVAGENPFQAWRGRLKELAGERSDDLVDEMRGERLEDRG